MDRPILIPKKGTGTLAGHVLIATPQVQDDLFHHSVIYMCSHDEQGAMGIIINAPIERISIQDILEQMNMSMPMGDRNLPVIFGGPVETYRGFVLHDGSYLQDSALASRDGITVSANIAVLTGWLQGEFPARAMLSLGYAGWGAGQLESEIETGSWVSVEATPGLVFDTPSEEKWNLATAALGFDLGNLSSTVGHA